MANIRKASETEAIRKRILLSAARLFIEKGYEQTSVKEISEAAGVPANTVFYEMKSKEDILCGLVAYFLDGINSAAFSCVNSFTKDKLFYYVADVCLQLYMAELSEDMRNLYLAAYSLPKTGEAVLKKRTEMVKNLLTDSLPQLETKDYYEIEVASMGIMRGYITVASDMYFTLQTKVKRCIEALLLIYRFSDERIAEALEFIGSFDFEKIAKEAVDKVFRELEIRKSEIFK